MITRRRMLAAVRAIEEFTHQALGGSSRRALPRPALEFVPWQRRSASASYRSAGETYYLASRADLVPRARWNPS